MKRQTITNTFILLNILLFWCILGGGVYWFYFHPKETVPSRYEFEAFKPHLTKSFSLPDTINFCGENVPLNDLEVRERLDRELMVNAHMQANTGLIIKRANRWFPEMTKILREEGIPEDFKYLCAVESNLENVVSPKKAAGYWQILEPTGKELGLVITPDYDERYDPLLATRAAAKYLKKAKEKLNSWTLAAASYNMGMSGIARASAQQFSDSYYDLWLNTETARYMYRILAFKIIMENPKKFYFELPKEQLYPPLEYRSITLDTAVNNLPLLAQKLDLSYKIFKFYNPALRTHKLALSKGQSVEIKIPLKSHRHGKNPSGEISDTNLMKELFGWADSLSTE